MGQFDSLVGMYQLQSKLMALEVIAVERGIFLTLILYLAQVKLLVL